MVVPTILPMRAKTIALKLGTKADARFLIGANRAFGESRAVHSVGRTLWAIFGGLSLVHSEFPYAFLTRAPGASTGSFSVTLDEKWASLNAYADPSRPLYLVQEVPALPRYRFWSVHLRLGPE